MYISGKAVAKYSWGFVFGLWYWNRMKSSWSQTQWHVLIVLDIWEIERWRLFNPEVQDQPSDMSRLHVEKLLSHYRISLWKLFSLCFSYKVSLCTPGWARTFHVDQAGPKPTSARIKSVCHHTLLQHLSKMMKCRVSKSGAFLPDGRIKSAQSVSGTFLLSQASLELMILLLPFIVLGLQVTIP